MDRNAMDDASRRAYEAARRAFEDAPEVKAHAWRGTLEKRAASKAVLDSGTVGMAAVAGVSGTSTAGVAPEDRAVVPASPSDSGTFAQGDRGASRDCAVRAENEDDDGYDPWSDRQPIDSFWEEDPWR